MEASLFTLACAVLASAESSTLGVLNTFEKFLLLCWTVKWYMTKFLVMNEKQNKLSVLITSHVIVVPVKDWEYRNCSRKFLWVSNTDYPQLLLLTLKKWFSIGSVSHYIRVQDFILLLRLSFICYNWFLHKYLKHRFGCGFFPQFKSETCLIYFSNNKSIKS